MNNLTRTLSTAALSLGLLFGASIASAATTPPLDSDPSNTTSYDNGGTQPSGMITSIINGGDYIVADGGAAVAEAYLLWDTQGGVNQNAIELSLDAYYTEFFNPPSAPEINDFMSSDDPGWFGTLVNGGISGTYDIGSGYAFNGFLVKASDVTLFVLFDQYVQSLTWNTEFTGDYFGLPNNAMSHVGVINPVPVPAAAFMFAPALLGFLGLRRRAKNTIA